MKAFIWSCPAGTFGIAGSKIIEFMPFPAEPSVLAKRLAALSKNEVLEEEIKVLGALSKKGYREILSLKSMSMEGIKTERAGAEEIYNLLPSLPDMKQRIQVGNEIVSLACIEGAQAMLKEEKKERIIIQTLGMYEDMVNILNIFHERLREWLLLCNPETARSVSNEQLVSLILSGEVENTGMEFDGKDMEALSSVAGMVAEFSKQRKQLEAYIDEMVKKEAPNLHAVCGFLLAAKLISNSGSVEKLARSPASRIQLLGAEKALFRHMREKTPSPKHGVILIHPLVQNSPKELKGRMARLLAAKISLAAKIDFFSHTDRGGELRKSLDSEAVAILKAGKR